MIVHRHNVCAALGCIACAVTSERPTGVEQTAPDPTKVVSR
jgi:hypothetical protein